MVTHYSLAFPEVKFVLIVDGKRVLQTAGNGKLRDTLAEVYGVEYIPCHVDYRIQGDEERFKFGEFELVAVHIPGHTHGSIALYIDWGCNRILFGQDIHGPYIREWGADPVQAKASLQKLIDLKADILCEGHFGVFEPAPEVESYIQTYLAML